MVNFFYTNSENKLVKNDKFIKNCWIDMINPTDVEVDEISKLTGISEDMIKAALDEEERARTEFDDGNNLFIVDCPIIEESDLGDVYTTLPLGIIYNDKCIITVCLKGNTVLKNFINGREKVATNKPVYFLLMFMLGNAKRFLYSLKQIDRKSHRVQAELERAMKNEDILHLLDLENSLVYFSTSLNSNYRVHEKLGKVEKIVSTQEEYADLFEDVVIESRQAIEMCNIYKDILTVTMDAYGSVISNNANDTMKRLTIITILLAIPTMIAGFWGMNVFVPGQSGEGSTLWFWVVLGATLALTVAVSLFMTKFTGSFFRAKQRKKRDKKRDN
ncbi:MAG: magnesium transporter CorA family protein [Clostridiales bacterium]|nr:magnesium transporter CorA family protein [Clostridiales bacterium]